MFALICHGHYLILLQDNLTYTIVDAEENAAEFFFVDEDSGAIMLKQSLATEDTETYKVLIGLHTINQH